MRVTINGAFFSMGMQGIVRYARELTVALDDVIDDSDDVEIAIDKDATDVPDFNRIRVRQVGGLRGKTWEQIDLAAYMACHPERMLLNLCNVAPLLARPGITAIHDVMYRTCPESYTSLRSRISRMWHCVLYEVLTRREHDILTVSKYSKEEICRLYPHAVGKVHVVPNAWQHVKRYSEATDWQERYPFLKPGEFFFSLATQARHKNGAWVHQVARRNPTCSFAIAGGSYDVSVRDVPANVHMLGFISDADVCALIKNCRAFLYPSLYEGFGLPPLEALALGAQVISSNATSLPEVLVDAVHYIDPTDYDIDLDEVLRQKVGPAHDALERFSWEDSARILDGVLARGVGTENDMRIVGETA